MKEFEDEICSIMSEAVKEILEKTEGNNSARDYFLDNICRSYIFALANTKYENDEKITSFKRQIDYFVLLSSF